MTKEEIEKEAKEYADWFWGASPSMMKALAEAYIKGAEPREKRIADLEKENAELKSENQKWKDEWQEQVQKATDEGYARTLQTIQLTKAKGLLERLLITSCNSDVLNLLPNCSEVLRVRVEAEQFISEVEK